MAGRVLIIDDNELIRVLVANALSEHGFVPLVASGGAEGLAMLGTGDFDLVVVDYVMPEMMGDELIRRVRASGHSRVRSLPILGLTGSVPEAGSRLMAAGADACIPKPFQDRKLVESAKRLLEARQPKGASAA